MKKQVPLFFLSLIIALSISDTALAEYVRGHYRKNGTYVSGYHRSDRNSSVTDNYSFKGNVNPYTGAVGTNYYRNSPSSPYYGTNSSRGWSAPVSNSWNSGSTGVFNSPLTGLNGSSSYGTGAVDKIRNQMSQKRRSDQFY